MTNDELCDLSATAMAPLIRDGALRAVDILDAVLARIDRLEPLLNAFALVDRDGARRAAVAADDARDKGGALGPLHGVPFSVKDLILTKGVETAFGSHLMAGNIPTRSAAVVERMQAAGAIMLGKTTTPEFAHSALTDSLRYGPTRNPWNRDFSCGGSSGGAAVAAATGMGPLTVTTDGAGSSRIPASCCGVLGLKATLGRIPNENAVDLFGNFIFLGAITRTTADLSAMLNVMSGPHAGDPWTFGAPHAPCEIPSDPESTLRGLRVHYKPRLGNELLDDGVAEAMEKTLTTLRRAGVTVTRSDGREDWGNELARVCIRATLAKSMAHISAADRKKMTPS
ncbi:MAG: aspartyl-tRNA(Asn)/glutamyl-tRNA(Gln) amidotransferase subunit A, partial [Gammaproteobacteria bacterium]